MPIPNAPFSDSDILARMQGALMAWRRVASVMAAARAPKGTVPLAALAIAMKPYKSLDEDLETIAHAFDAYPAVLAHVTDLRREVERLERTSAHGEGGLRRSLSPSVEMDASDFSTTKDLSQAKKRVEAALRGHDPKPKKFVPQRLLAEVPKGETALDVFEAMRGSRARANEEVIGPHERPRESTGECVQCGYLRLTLDETGICRFCRAENRQHPVGVAKGLHWVQGAPGGPMETDDPLIAAWDGESWWPFGAEGQRWRPVDTFTVLGPVLGPDGKPALE